MIQKGSISISPLGGKLSLLSQSILQGADLFSNPKWSYKTQKGKGQKRWELKQVISVLLWTV